MTGASYQELLAPAPISRRPPMHVEASLPAVFGEEERAYPVAPAAGLYRADGGHADSMGRCRTALGSWIPWNARSLPSGSAEAALAWDPRSFWPCEFHPGAVAALTHPRQRSFYHWLFDVLPRYALLRQTGIVPAAVYIDQSQGFQRESWAKVGTGMETLDAGTRRRLRASTLLVPSAVSTSGVPPAWVCRWLKDSLARGTRDTQRVRIYVSRRDVARGEVANEAEIEGVLAEHGFITLHSESLPLSEQIDFFSRAEAVVGPHGAGLANTVFAPAHCKVIEMFAPMSINVCYWTLCCQAGMPYAFMLGSAAGGRGGPGRPSIRVDPAKLQTLLAAVLPGSAQVATNPKVTSAPQ